MSLEPSYTEGSLSEVEFLAFPLTTDELQILPQDQRAAYAVLCFAATETNALLRIFSFTTSARSKSAVINRSVEIQSNVVLRSLSAKVYEFAEFFNTGINVNKTSDEELKKFMRCWNRKFTDLKRMDGFKVAEDLRNNVTNHYRLKPARQSLDYVRNSGDASLYTSDFWGNNFYPFGEEALFLGRLNKLVGQESRSVSENKKSTEWLEWVLKAQKLVEDALADFIQNFLVPRYEGKNFEEKLYSIPSALVASPTRTMLPPFVMKGE